MALVAIQCKNCGGALQVDSGAKNYYCPHCHTTYAMEQTVNQTFQTTNIGHIDTANIIDDGSGKIDQEIYSGEALLQLKKYKEAREAFWNLSNHYAHRHRAWWGLARAVTEDFTKEPAGKRQFCYVRDTLQSALQLAPANERAEIEEAKNIYCSRWQGYCNQLAEERSQRLEEIELRIREMLPPQQQKIEEIKSEIEKKRAKLKRLEKTKKIVPIVGFAVGLLLMCLLAFLTNSTGGVIALLLSFVLFSGLIIFLPLKIVFIIIYKAVQTPTNLAIKKSNEHISQIEKDIRLQTKQLDGEKLAVMTDTGWLDH